VGNGALQAGDSSEHRESTTHRNCEGIRSVCNANGGFSRTKRGMELLSYYILGVRFCGYQSSPLCRKLPFAKFRFAALKFLWLDKI
jgi:hypothetical protein